MNGRLLVVLLLSNALRFASAQFPIDDSNPEGGWTNLFDPSYTGLNWDRTDCTLFQEATPMPAPFDQLCTEQGGCQGSDLLKINGDCYDCQHGLYVKDIPTVDNDLWCEYSTKCATAWAVTHGTEFLGNFEHNGDLCDDGSMPVYNEYAHPDRDCCNCDRWECHAVTPRPQVVGCGSDHTENVFKGELGQTHYQGTFIDGMKMDDADHYIMPIAAGQTIGSTFVTVTVEGGNCGGDGSLAGVSFYLGGEGLKGLQGDPTFVDGWYPVYDTKPWPHPQPRTNIHDPVPLGNLRTSDVPDVIYIGADGWILTFEDISSNKIPHTFASSYTTSTEWDACNGNSLIGGEKVHMEYKSGCDTDVPVCDVNTKWFLPEMLQAITYKGLGHIKGIYQVPDNQPAVVPAGGHFTFGCEMNKITDEGVPTYRAKCLLDETFDVTESSRCKPPQCTDFTPIDQHCYTTGDPHIYGFDGQRWSFQQNGDFWLYKSDKLAVEVREESLDRPGEGVSGNAAIAFQGELSCGLRIEIYGAFRQLDYDGNGPWHSTGTYRTPELYVDGIQVAGNSMEEWEDEMENQNTWINCNGSCNHVIVHEVDGKKTMRWYFLDGTYIELSYLFSSYWGMNIYLQLADEHRTNEVGMCFQQPLEAKCTETLFKVHPKPDGFTAGAWCDDKRRRLLPYPDQPAFIDVPAECEANDPDLYWDAVDFCWCDGDTDEACVYDYCTAGGRIGGEESLSACYTAIELNTPPVGWTPTDWPPIQAGPTLDMTCHTEEKLGEFDSICYGGKSTSEDVFTLVRAAGEEDLTCFDLCQSKVDEIGEQGCCQETFNSTDCYLAIKGAAVSVGDGGYSAANVCVDPCPYECEDGEAGCPCAGLDDTLPCFGSDFVTHTLECGTAIRAYCCKQGQDDPACTVDCPQTEPESSDPGGKVKENNDDSDSSSGFKVGTFVGGMFTGIGVVLVLVGLAGVVYNCYNWEDEEGKKCASDNIGDEAL